MKQTNVQSNKKATVIAAGIVAGVVAASVVLSVSGSRVSARAVALGEATVSPEMKAQETAWKQGEDPAKIRGRVLNLYKLDSLTRGEDLYLGSKILETSPSGQDQAVAHDMALAAMVLGVPRALEVVTRTHDKILSQYKVPARYRSDNPAIPSRIRAILTSGLKTVPIVETVEVRSSVSIQ